MHNCNNSNNNNKDKDEIRVLAGLKQITPFMIDVKTELDTKTRLCMGPLIAQTAGFLKVLLDLDLVRLMSDRRCLYCGCSGSAGAAIKKNNNSSETLISNEQQFTQLHH